HCLFADGLKLLILDMGRGEYQVDQSYSAQSAIDLVSSGKQYDLILTDLDMPGIGGFELLQSFSNRDIDSYVAIISASSSIQDIRKAYAMGARGYICKSEASFDMQTKLNDLLAGKTCFPEEFWDSLDSNLAQPESIARNSNPVLGKRPMEVLNLLAQGKSNKQIAAILNITETTVKFHVRTLFTTFGVNNRTWCVREASRRGLIETDNI
ncbi:MAG: response regulator transcription factor, partial [Pseudomonadales bacterium]